MNKHILAYAIRKKRFNKFIFNESRTYILESLLWRYRDDVGEYR